MTIKDLQQKNNTLNFLDLDLLLAHAINKPREFLYTYPEFRLSPTTYCLLRYYLWQRRRGIPLAYITGHKEFYGLDFLVNKHTLIPRPDTELMVDEAIKSLTTTPYSLQPTLLVDVGAGSGCIPIAIAKTIEQLNNRTIKTFAIDISRPALRVARKNAKRHGVDITFLHGDLLEPFFKKAKKKKSKKAIEQLNNRTIIITANLPYLTQSQFDSELSIQQEPISALVADAKDGLSLYEKLIKQIQSLISSFPNFSISVFLEHDPRQTELLKNFISIELPQASVEIKTDLAGRNRLAKIIIEESDKKTNKKISISHL